MASAVSTLLAVDPGIDRCGLAVFVDGKLVWTGHEGKPLGSTTDLLYRVRATVKEVHRALSINGFSMDCFNDVVLEWPQIRMPGKSKGPGKDLLMLAAIDGAIVSGTRLAAVRTIRPDEWKGQCKDSVIVGRVSGRLDPKELASLVDAYKRVPESLRHNVTDAIGIGLWSLGRMG